MLTSELFKGDGRLAACQLHDTDHIFLGAVGDHVAKIQMALFVSDGLAVGREDRYAKRYGPSTARAVLAFKSKRRIINRSYELQVDDIVGKMTINALDREVAAKERLFGAPKPICCGNDPDVRPRASAAASRGRVLSLTSAIGGPPASPASAKADALSNVPVAKQWVATTRAVLTGLIATVTSPSAPPLPPDVLRRFDKVWAHFGVPKGLPVQGPFGQVTDLASFLSTISATYQKVATTLGNAGTVFRDLAVPLPAGNTFVGSDTKAFTMDDHRNSGEPTGADWPNGIYFKSEFLPLGPKKKTEIIVHEPVHFIDTSVFQDVRKPFDPDYKTISVAGHLTNAWSYSQFVLDVVFNREMPFDLDE